MGGRKGDRVIVQRGYGEPSHGGGPDTGVGKTDEFSESDGESEG